MEISAETDTGIIRLTGKAKLNPWIQILHANLPVNIKGNVKLAFSTLLQNYNYIIQQGFCDGITNQICSRPKQ